METQVVEGTELMNVASLMPQARENRRDAHEAIQTAIMWCCTTQETAEACFYSMPRDHKMITGPSIWLAETLAAAWGNLMINMGTIEETDTHIIVRGQVLDLQSGAFVGDFVRRRISTSEGVRYNEDMVNTTLMAARKILHRNLVLALVPRPLVQRVCDAAMDKAAGHDFAERVTNALAHWKALGVTEEELLRYLKKAKVEDIDQLCIAHLLGIHAAVKDVKASVDDIFRKAPKEDAPASTDALKAELKARAEEAEPTPEPPHPGDAAQGTLEECADLAEQIRRYPERGEDPVTADDVGEPAPPEPEADPETIDDVPELLF